MISINHTSTFNLAIAFTQTCVSTKVFINNVESSKLKLYSRNASKIEKEYTFKRKSYEFPFFSN